ncbi:MAG: hypothetical protein BWK80_48600, partial [Desulfobacteraceae bacterium IS3]
ATCADDNPCVCIKKIACHLRNCCLFSESSIFFRNFDLYVIADRGAPRCHGIYGDYGGSFGIEDGELIAGQMPPPSPAGKENKIIYFGK